MITLEPICLEVATLLVVLSFGSLINNVAASFRQDSADDGVRTEDEVVAQADVEFPQVLKPGSPGPYVPRGFDALGLHADATPDEVLAAYRQLAIEAHPDHGGTIEQFTQLQENFELAMAHAEGRILHPTGNATT